MCTWSLIWITLIRYKDPNEPDKITVDGIMKFLDDLGLPPDSKLVLIIAWKFKAATQCEFSRDEFINGMTGIGCDSIDKLKQRLPGLESELRDSYKFKDFYQFTFNFAKNPNQKGLDLDMAIAYWNIVLKGKFKFLESWCTFLQVGCHKKSSATFNVYSHRKTINDQYRKTRGICCWTLLNKFRMI